MSLEDVQTAVVKEINDNLSLDSVAEEAFTPEFVLEKMETQKIVVVPVDVENPKRMNRDGKWEELPRIEIGIGQRAKDKAEIKLRIAVAQTIREHFKDIGTVVGVTGQYVVMSVNFMPYYDFDTLDEDHMVLSVISILFKEFTG